LIALLLEIIFNDLPCYFDGFTHIKKPTSDSSSSIFPKRTRANYWVKWNHGYFPNTSINSTAHLFSNYIELPTSVRGRFIYKNNLLYYFFPTGEFLNRRYFTTWQFWYAFQQFAINDRNTLYLDSFISFGGCSKIMYNVVETKTGIVNSLIPHPEGPYFNLMSQNITRKSCQFFPPINSTWYINAIVDKGGILDRYPIYDNVIRVDYSFKQPLFKNLNDLHSRLENPSSLFPNSRELFKMTAELNNGKSIIIRPTFLQWH
jgi:hypothetical protein